jgi:hypothetical protein
MIKSYNARFSYGIMNRISSVAIAIMLTMTTMGTGSLENPDFERTNNNSNGFNSGENDTINRTNTFPFDVLFDDYYNSSSEVYADLFNFQNDYPDIVELYTLTDLLTEGGGSTYKNNEIYAIKISDNVANEPAFYDDPDEETYFIVSNHHSREWMTIPTAMYFIYYLTHFYGMEPTDNDGDGLINEDMIDGVDNDGDGEQGGRVDEFGRALFDGIDNDGDGIIDEGIDEDPSEARVTHLVNNRETWIIPLLNPDGYNYDREDPSRFWRKNLRDNDGNEQPGECDGVDLNRNYPFEWSHNTQGQAVLSDDVEVEPTVDDDNPCSDVYHGPRDLRDEDGDCDQAWCDTPVSIGDSNTQTGIDEDPPDVFHRDDDGDGMVDEDIEGGFSEPETQVIEQLIWRLDIYEDYPQDKYLEDYQNGIIRENWPEMWVYANDGDYVRNYRTEAHDMKHNIMNSVSYHSYSALYIWPWGFQGEDPPHELYMENQVKPLMNVTGYGNWKDEGGYKVSGDITDYLYGMQGSFSYTVELNYANQGGLEGGFHADPLLIRPTVRMHLLTNIHFMDESPKARLGQMYMSDTANLDIETINSPEDTMMPELTILSNKNDAKIVGFGTDTNVEFDEEKIYSNDDISVRVSVENAQYLLKDSLKLKYRNDMMPEDIWEEVTMSCVSGCDIKDYSNYNSTGGVVVRNSVYEAKIPETEDSMNVQFYAVGQDSRLAYAFGGGFVYTGYGNAEPLEVFVDDIIGFGNPFVDFFAMLFMMGMLYGVVWGGLYKAVGIATEAEKKKEGKVSSPKRTRKAKRS